MPTVKSRNPLLAQMHIAKKQMGLDDDTYRDILNRVTGSRSAAGLSEKQRHAVIAEFRRMGWGGGTVRKKSPKAYVRKIFAMWGQLKRDGIWRESDPASLRRFVQKLTGCDDPDWLTYPQASKVIEALKEMGDRA